MGVPPEISSVGYEFRLFVISAYVNMSICRYCFRHVAYFQALAAHFWISWERAVLRARVASGIDVCVDVQMKLERRVNIDDANQLVIDEFLDAQADYNGGSSGS